MKSKYLALVLVVVLVLVGLVACGQAGQQEQQEPQNLDIQQTEPVDTAEPVESDTPDEPEATQAPEDNAPANLSQQSQPEDNIISDDELLTIFNMCYEAYKEVTLSFEFKIESELKYVVQLAGELIPGKQLPEDYIIRYIDWRPIDGEEDLFDDCNETVYTTIDMNIRESWSTSSTNVGSLGVGQSITRIGTGIPGTDAEGWSKVQLSDGTVAYMVSSYLSTTKPSTGGNGGGNGGGSGGGSGGSQQGGGGGSGGLHGGVPPISGNGNDTVGEGEYNNGTGPDGWGSAGDAGEGVHMN